MHVLSRLSDMGVQLAIDDFGIGRGTAQGYYLSRPVKAAELAAWLRATREGERSQRLRSA